MTDRAGQSLADRIMTAVNESPGVTDRELTDNLIGAHSHPSRVNQVCRWLESTGSLSRNRRGDGLIGNYPSGVAPASRPSVRLAAATAESLSEDEVKEHLRRWLEGDGWLAEIAWGRERGTDIVARRGSETWLIEVKGCGSRPEMRVNYFVGVLGELLQRMSIAEARYSIAMPDISQFRRLWDRLPALARRRTGITAMFVSAGGAVSHSAHDGPGQAGIDPQGLSAPNAGSMLGLVPGIDMMCECAEAGKEPCRRHPCETFAERMFRSGFPVE